MNTRAENLGTETNWFVGANTQSHRIPSQPWNCDINQSKFYAAPPGQFGRRKQSPKRSSGLGILATPQT